MTNDFATPHQARNRAETEARPARSILQGESTPALPVTKRCYTCKVEKTIHFFTSSEWKVSYGRCRECVKQHNLDYNTRTGRTRKCVPFTSVPMGEQA